MKYYYLDGIDKLGPYSSEEIKSRNLSTDTMVLKGDNKKWLPLKQFKEFNKKPKEINIEDKTLEKRVLPSQKNNRYLKFLILAIIILFISFFVYKHYSLSEDETKDLANRFFNAVLVENIDYNTIDEIYPDFRSIGSVIDFQNTCTINNISRNKDYYEVYASYNHSKNKSYPIYLLVGKVKGDAYIISSTGINFAFYDKVYNYGRKKGCFSGNEDDFQIGRIIDEYNLRSEFEYSVDIELRLLKRKLQITSDLYSDYFGFTKGSVTIKNNNDIDFKYSEFDCRVEFYDKNGQITHSKKLPFYELDAQSSTTEMVMTAKKHSLRYNVIPRININSRIKDLIKNKVISEIEYGCFN